MRFGTFLAFCLTALAAGPVAAGGCPPGLAKKSPACVPPGLAKKGVVAVPYDEIRIGDPYTRWPYHRVTRPGLYGLPPLADGTDYYILDGYRLVRVDPGTGRILDLIAAIDAILD